jgi:methylated-DNA-[protein]-cysteine S-methyltransferase
MMHCARFQTSWGYFCLAVTPKGVCGTILPVASARLADELANHRWPEAHRDPRIMPDLQSRVVAYFDGEPVDFAPELDLRGVTEFRRRVLRACAEIRHGTTITYGELAERIGSPNACRAVGGAMAANPVPLIIPCHRVLAADGRLGGFSAIGGVATKARMLRLERCATPVS